MKPASALEELIDALRCLPGVGPKSAQRMAYHLLQYDPAGAQRLAGALGRALGQIRRCSRCNTFTEERDLRAVRFAEARPGAALRGGDARRSRHDGADARLPGALFRADGAAVAAWTASARGTSGSTGSSRGPATASVKEVILATNFTNEGEATAHYIGEMLRGRDLKISRIARGIPVGGELEYRRPGHARPGLLRAAARMTRRKPLEGLKVIELGQLIAGPFAGKFFAEFGAEVIKIEPPEGGDPLRQWRKLHEGTSLWWYVQNRDKKSVTVNLRLPEGQEIVRRLARDADS